jgi:two-component system sensor histidine kinase YesM
VIQALVRKTNNIRIKNKLISFFILIVIIPVVIVGGFLTVAFRQTVMNHAILQTSNNVEKIKSRTADILRMPIQISNRLLSDTRMEKVVNTQYKSTFEVVEAYRGFQDFRDYTSLYKEIYNIRFYTTNPTILNNWDFIQPDESILQSTWYGSMMQERTEKISWIALEDETKNNAKYLSLVRRIFFPNYRSSGVLVVDVNQDELNNILSQEPFDTMIFDGNGYVVAAKNTDWVGKNLDQLNLPKGFQEKKTGTYEDEFNGHASKMLVVDLLPDNSSNGLKIVSIFTIASIVKEPNQIILLGFFIIMGSLLIALVLIFFSSGILSSRLLKLNKQLNKVAMGDLHVTSPIDGKDEIGMLSKQFNNMVGSIRELMDEVHESNRVKSQLELRQKEIKLKMLASQINPHFLFNVLESIRMKAHIKGEDEIAAIVRSLGKLMRKNLEVSGSKISLSSEMEIVRCYLEIQQFRFGDRLDFELIIDPLAKDILLLPLIIQPLVENAVVHGLENKETSGRVTVRTEIIANQLYVEVKDNGVGISEARIIEIEHVINDTEDQDEYRIGLRNVHQRLLMTYGEPHGLNITSESGEQTRIYFTIPLE